MKTNRRKFLKSAAVIGFPTIIPSSVLGLDGSITPNIEVPPTTLVTLVSNSSPP